MSNASRTLNSKFAKIAMFLFIMPKLEKKSALYIFLNISFLVIFYSSTFYVIAYASSLLNHSASLTAGERSKLSTIVANYYFLLIGSLLSGVFTIFYKKKWLLVYNMLNLKILLKNGTEIQDKTFNRKITGVFVGLTLMFILEFSGIIFISPEGLPFLVTYHLFFTHSLINATIFNIIITEISYKLITFKQLIFENPNDADRISDALKLVLKILKDIRAFDFVFGPQGVFFIGLTVYLVIQNVTDVMDILLRNDNFNSNGNVKYWILIDILHIGRIVV